MFKKTFMTCEANEPSANADNIISRAKIDFITMGISLFGFAVSLYALIEHIKAKSGQAGQLSCDFNATISCSTILTSEYGEFFNIPLGAFGMAFWTGIFVVAILPKLTQVSKSYLAFWRLLSASIGIITALALAYLAYFVIKGVCVVCATVQITCAVYFVYAVVMYFKNKNLKGENNANAFGKLFSMVLLCAVPNIIFGLIAPPFIIEALSKNNTAAAATKNELKVPSTPIPDDLLKVAKSNYVGNGEDYRMGNDAAKTVIHMFTDPECPACKAASEPMESALKTVGLDKVLLVVHLYPLDGSCNPRIGNMHQHACNLSLGARCAGQQGKFFEFLHWAYKNQEATPVEKAVTYSPKGIKETAVKLGIKETAFNQCFDAKVEMAKIKDDLALGEKLGLTGTPFIIINNKRFTGNPTSPSDLVDAIEIELR